MGKCLLRLMMDEMSHVDSEKDFFLFPLICHLIIKLWDRKWIFRFTYRHLYFQVAIHFLIIILFSIVLDFYQIQNSLVLSKQTPAPNAKDNHHGQKTDKPFKNVEPLNQLNLVLRQLVGQQLIHLLRKNSIDLALHKSRISCIYVNVLSPKACCSRKFSAGFSVDICPDIWPAIGL